MDATASRQARFVGLFVGDEPRQMGRWLLITLGLSALIVGTVAVTGPRSILLTISHPLFVIPVSPAVGSLLTVGWITIAAVPGYYGDGLVASWLLLFCLLVSGPLADEVLFFSMMEGSKVFVTATAVTTSVILGTVGYFVGRAVRRHRALD
ncbi:hypothetical protein [Haloprofundus halophilus]|uniref:hypothetical protein n=1 Tax=Haloprofundus halophilus TaxID=2283527 RepID=UPI000E439E4A|nr:hypothetical protein [Haloprofundus halophilus]